MDGRVNTGYGVGRGAVFASKGVVMEGDVRFGGDGSGQIVESSPALNASFPPVSTDVELYLDTMSLDQDLGW